MSDADADTDADSDTDSDTASVPDTDTGSDPDTDIGVVDGELDLGTARALLVGESPGDHSSASLAVGELTGDGVTDVVIGSWWWETNQEGSAYVMSADAIGTVSLADAEARLTGSTENELVGCSVAVDDLDGDLQDDLLIGAYDAAFVVAGPVSGTLRAEDVALARFVRASAEDAGVCFYLAATGDLNIDGDRDFLIAYEGEGGEPTSVFVADASPPGIYDLDDLPDRVEGTLGHVAGMASADVDGDGVQDLLVGDFAIDAWTGRLLVIHGPINGVGSLEDADAILSGPTEESMFGVFVLNAGDVNGDGREDVLVGAPGASQEPPVPGSVYLWTSELADVQPASSADALIEGIEPGSGVGITLASADVDGDGETDLLLGAPLIGQGSANFGFGGAYLMHGPFSGSLDVEDAILLRGEVAEPEGLVGGPLASLGDVDGDGLDDLAVTGSGIQNESGGTYLVFGSDF